jgi:MFS family permease
MQRTRSPGVRALAAAALLTTVGVLPVFLLGGLAVLVRADLGFDEVRLGISVAAYFAAAAVGSVHAGRLAQQFGAQRSLRWGAALSVGCLLGVASAQTWLLLTASLLIGGIANSLIQVAANLLLSGAVSPARQGLAFGVKQAAIPAATLLGGLAVPLVGVTVGWRWAFVLAAVLALVATATQRQQGAGVRPAVVRPSVATAPAPLVVLAAGAGCGAAAANSLGSFLVEFVVSVGWSPAAAGRTLAIGSLAGLGARLLVGWLADRGASRTLRGVAAQLGLGAIAFALLPSAGGTLPALTAVVVLAFATGWGWPGLFNFLVVRENRAAPAAATGVTQAGVYAGGVVGPLAFGAAVQYGSYALAWRGAGGVLLLGAVLLLVGRRLAAARPRG